MKLFDLVDILKAVCLSGLLIFFLPAINRVIAPEECKLYRLLIIMRHDLQLQPESLHPLPSVADRSAAPMYFKGPS